MVFTPARGMPDSTPFTVGQTSYNWREKSKSKICRVFPAGLALVYSLDKSLIPHCIVIVGLGKNIWQAFQSKCFNRMMAAKEADAKTKASAYFAMKEYLSNGIFNKINSSNTLIREVVTFFRKLRGELNFNMKYFSLRH